MKKISVILLLILALGLLGGCQAANNQTNNPPANNIPGNNVPGNNQTTTRRRRCPKTTIP